MEGKTFKIVGNDISDGYHTFDELYDHRCLLYLTWLVEEKRHGGGRVVYWVQDHFPGWDLVATNIEQKQISYHVPAVYRDALKTWFIERSNLEHVFDGHTSGDVVARMRERLEQR